MLILSNTILLIICVIIIIITTKKTGSLVNAINILTILTIFDCAIPTYIYCHLNDISQATYKSKIALNDLVIPTLLYAFYLCIITFTYLYTTFNSKRKPYSINILWIKYLLVLLLLSFFILLIHEINIYGGINAWINLKSLARWKGYRDGNLDVLLKIKSIIPFNALIIFCILILLQSSIKKYQKLVYFTCGLLMVITTFYRGSLLVYLFSCIYIYNPSYIHQKFVQIKSKIGKKLLLALLVSCFSFFTYGLIRNQLSTQAWQGQAKKTTFTTYAFEVLAQGSGITSFAHIVNYYGSDNKRLFKSKTIFDALCLPIPRFIYKNKPDWYGISDITREMSWPNSTQDAVTIPGELFANFGYFSILIYPLFGILFKRFDHSTYSANIQKRAVYFSVVIYALLISHWMSVTGLMNNFLALISVVIVRRIFKR